MKKHVSILLIFVLLMSLSGCRKKPTNQRGDDSETIELTYYKMYDDEDVLAPLISDWSLKNNVIIHYKKFADFDEYLRTILNEMAEGEGPDIFSMPNNWFMSNYKKISPITDDFAPEGYRITDAFSEMFVDVAAKDLIRPDEKGVDQVYGLPMTVDTLALYYNKDYFEDRLPSQGRPSKTWDGINDDVLQLNRYNEDTNDFQLSGIAMGRGDNISRGVDILYLLFLQFGVEFYNENISQAIFAQRQNNLQYLGLDALDLLTSFADINNKHYSWNEYVIDDEAEGKEELAFARGDVAMIVGFSYTYENIVNYIKLLESANEDSISKNDIYVTQITQLEDPDLSSSKRITYANYFVETVSRNCEYPELAWDLLVNLTQKDSLDHYFKETHRPTSRRDMIEEQQKDSTYGVFASQIGFAESFPVLDHYTYKDLFSQIINSATSSSTSQVGLAYAQDAINNLLPEEGLIPAIKPAEEEEEEDED